MDQKRETIGKIAYDILNKEAEYVNPNEVMGETEKKDYMKTLFETLEKGKKQFINQNFFIVVNLKHETVLKVVFRNLFELRNSCPTPFFDQTVYMYDYSKDELDLIWQIPDEKTCWKLYEYRNHVDPSQFELLNYVIAAKDGTLWRKMKELNGEKFDSPLLEK